MPSPSLTADDLRVRAWLEIREPLERQLEPLGRVVIDALRLTPGERVLDVGCGVGRTPFALAQAVGPAGGVVGIDPLGAALEVLRADPGLPANLALVCGDAQSHAFAPAVFDAVFSRFGVMFFGDPVKAFANLRRALRPGGRLGFVCWRSFAENELDHLPLRAAAPDLPKALVEQTASSAWFSFADPDAIRSALSAAGLEQVEIAPHDHDVSCGSLRATVDVCSRVGALGKILRENPELAPAATAALERELRSRAGVTSGE